MEIKVENLAIIKDANIRLNGLTVIAGENDSGKSTIGKLVFALIQAMNPPIKDITKNKEDVVKGILFSLYLAIRQDFQLVQHPRLVKHFEPDTFFNELIPYIRSGINESNPNGFFQILIAKKIEIITDEVKNAFPHSKTTYNHLDLKYRSFLDNIFSAVIFKADKIQTIKTNFRKALFSEFTNEISPRTNNESSSLEVTDNNNPLIKITIKSDNIQSFDILDEYLPFKDASFIETPTILQLYNIINYADILNGTNGKHESDRPKVSLHTKDLMQKLKNAQYYFSSDKEKNFLNEINQIINGVFEYDGAKGDFLFSKNNNEGKSFSIRASNVASGIKSFGIIQLLYQAEILDKNSLLIIDEPETHLHPKWQIEYAKILVALVKKGIPILVASHSPYIIQALKVFSEESEEIKYSKNKVNFYLSTVGEDGMSTISNVNDNMNLLFSKLSQPLQNLVWA